MRAFSLSFLISFAFDVSQNADLYMIADKYGFPTLVAVVMFVYFSREIRKKDQDASGYRRAVLAEQREQTVFLRSMLAEQRKAAYCKFIENQEKKEEKQNEHDESGKR